MPAMWGSDLEVDISVYLRLGPIKLVVPVRVSAGGRLRPAGRRCGDAFDGKRGPAAGTRPADTPAVPNVMRARERSLSHTRARWPACGRSLTSSSSR